MINGNKESKLDRGGHYIALKFEEGWWFVQAMITSYEEIKPWTLKNEDGDREEIAPNTAGTEDEIRDEANRLLLEPNDSERGTINQLLFGIAPSRIQLIPAFGREQNLGLEETMRAGEDEVWIDGFDSPYNNPTRASEIYYINDMSRLRLQAYNPTDEPLEAKLTIGVNRIQYATVNDVNVMKAMLQGQVPVHKHPMGLGSTESDQLSMPTWLTNAFGEYIKTTEEILEEGDTSQSSSTVDQLQSAENNALSRADRGGGS